MSGSVSMVDGHIDPDKGRMTPQEAIQRIKQHNEIHIKKKRFAIYITEALNMAVEALEKQIPKKPKTEFERIKAMSIDEMAEYFLTKSFDPCDITNFPVVDCDAGCDKCIRKWLESEVKAE